MSHIAPPSRDLLMQVRAGFLLKHTTLAQWCRESGIHPSAARQAIYGTWDGPKGRVMRARILKAAGVDRRSAA
jgi:hypothetical protein